MGCGVEAGAKFLEERDRPALKVGKTQVLGFVSVPPLQDSQEHREHIRDEALIVGHPISDLEWQAEHPLPHRHLWEDVVH